MTRFRSASSATVETSVTGGPAWRKVVIEGRKDGAGRNGGAIVVKKESGFYFPPKDEALAYDEDGNLIQDGRWNWEWDGEPSRGIGGEMDEAMLSMVRARVERPNQNRLKAMETNPFAAAVGVPLQRLEFAYDSQSRRVRKVLKEWDAIQETFVLKKDTRFLYDGWNVIAEFESNTGVPPVSGASVPLVLQATYAWGLDLSGTETGAGGVGGLLFVKLHSTTLNHSSTTVQQPSASTLAPCYDGNGNILAYMDCATGQTLARYEYDPFGKLLLKDEDTRVAGRLHHQFSTKYTDDETGLSYYGFRYYAPEIGRWVSRDPIGERGGLNLYGMVRNNLLSKIDKLGLEGCPNTCFEYEIAGQRTGIAVRDSEGDEKCQEICAALANNLHEAMKHLNFKDTPHCAALSPRCRKAEFAGGATNNPPSQTYVGIHGLIPDLVDACGCDCVLKFDTVSIKTYEVESAEP